MHLSLMDEKHALERGMKARGSLERTAKDIFLGGERGVGQLAAGNSGCLDGQKTRERELRPSSPM